MLNTTISEWGRDDLQFSPIERRKMADGLFISYQKQARRGGAIPCASGKGCGEELASTKFGQISSARKVIAALDVTKDKISYYRAYPVAG